MYQTIMQLLTTMHFVKLNDKSQRAQSTVTLLVPRIQAMQHNVEKLILAFMRKLSRTAGTSIPLQDPALFQMTCQVRSIEQQIKRLNHARAIVLKREYLSENHVRQLKAELFRAMQLTYGYPRIVQTGKLNTRQWLQTVCLTYAGADKLFQGTIVEQISRLPRCGGVFAQNPGYVFQRDRSWHIRFGWSGPPSRSSQTRRSRPSQTSLASNRRSPSCPPLARASSPRRA